MNPHLGAPVVSLPSEADLNDLFGTTPIEAEPSDGFWAYELDDAKGGRLSLSIDAFARSIDVSVARDQDEVLRVTQEGVTAVTIERGSQDARLRVTAESRDIRTVLEVCIRPLVSVRSTTLLINA